MLLATRQIAVGDIRRYTISYRDFLAKGVILDTSTVTVPAGTTSSIGTGARAPSFSPDFTELAFYVIAGSLDEKFTVSVQVTDTNSEIVNDTMNFTVVAP